MRYKRRKILEAAGGTVTGSALATSVSGTNPTGTFKGISYDPFTHKYQRDCRMDTIVDGNYNLSGRLYLGGYEISISKENSLVPVEVGEDILVYQITLGESEHLNEEDRPLKALINHRGENISGYLTRPGHDYDRIAFTLLESDKVSVEGLKRGLIGSGEGNPKRTNRPLPDKGVPRTIEPKEDD